MRRSLLRPAEAGLAAGRGYTPGTTVPVPLLEET